jgi:ribosomal subunit interface protein
MTRRIAFRHIDSTPVLEEFANKHLDKLQKFLEHERTPVSIDLVLDAATVHAHHKAELRVKTPDYDLVAHHEGPDMYQEIDHVTDIMLGEIRRAKDKLMHERRTKDSYKSA